MDQEIIDALSQSEAYPHRAPSIEVCQTHASVVFLAGDYAYKLKKPLDLGFFDYSTLDKRQHFCRREIELNNRLAPDVYLDVVSIIESDGQLQIDIDSGDRDDAVEYAVRMKRLDDADTLRARFERGAIPPGIFERLGRRLAQFHEEAKRGPEVDRYAAFDVVEKNALDNFSQTRDHVGHTVDSDVFERLQAMTEQRLAEFKPLIERRANNGAARDTHGDLRLEHIYIIDGAICIVDCIEFSEAFRYADPISDIAFLVMDLGFRGYDDEAAQLLDAYFDETGDNGGQQLVDFYVAYRSCVRAKVHGFKSLESEVPKPKREEARQKAQAHWLYALSRIEGPHRGPELILLAGLPAAGKSTLGRKLVDDGDADILIESDVVRKQLAGIDPDDSADADFGEGIYTREFSEKTYDEVARRAARHLKKGRRVAIAATFVTDARRLQMIDVARRLGIPVRFVECKIPEDIAHRRLKTRTDDVSDAGIDVYEKLKDAWETPSPPVARVHETKRTC